MQTFIDLHCHPSIKPYGQSFKSSPVGQNSTNRKKRNSIWFYDSPGTLEKGLQSLAGICKFTQSDCTTLTYANTRIACASLYPVEKGFFNNKLGTRLKSDLGNNFITCVGRARVNYVQGITNYFEDLEREMAFYKQLDGVMVKTDVGNCTYRLANNFHEIEQHLEAENSDDHTVFFIMTVEGMHALHTHYDLEKDADETAIQQNVAMLKNWQPRPLFVTLAHHFYNQLCGHARSLFGLVSNVSDQSMGLDKGITTLGEKVIKQLLDNTSGQRIYIDIKHMSVTSRSEYFDILQSDFTSELIPVIVSHGAANGLRSAKEPVQDNMDTAPKLLDRDINFYDDEILIVAKTRGIFGLQLDERRIASQATLKNTKHAFFLNKIKHYRAELLWNQVQHIAELLDSNNLFAWDCIAIGSDFDGIIDPLNGFLTAETFEQMQEYLERYAFNYMDGVGKTRLKTFNQVGAAEIVNRVFSTNAMDFFRRWFI